MERTWKPTVAGILIISATLLTGFLYVYMAVLGGISEEGATTFAEVMLGIAAIAGGYLALKRIIWWLALAGPICGLISAWPEQVVFYMKYGEWYHGIQVLTDAAMFLSAPFVMYIVAVIFLALSKREFS